MAKLFKCLGFGHHFKLIYLLPLSKVVFIALCAGKQYICNTNLELRKWNLSNRQSHADDLPRLKRLPSDCINIEFSHVLNLAISAVSR